MKLLSKKSSFLIVLALAILLLTTYYLLLSAPPALAQNLAPQCDPTLPPNSPTGTPCNVNAFIIWIKRVITFMFTIAIPLGVITIVYGGFVIMTAGGSGDRVEKGKGIIKAAVIGLVIAFSAYLIITALNFFITDTKFQFK